MHLLHLPLVVSLEDELLIDGQVSQLSLGDSIWSESNSNLLLLKRHETLGLEVTIVVILVAANLFEDHHLVVHSLEKGQVRIVARVGLLVLVGTTGAVQRNHVAWIHIHYFLLRVLALRPSHMQMVL